MAQKIDVGKVLAERAPKIARHVPGFLVKGLRKLICEEQMNDILEAADGLSGVPFCSKALERLGVTYTVKGSLPEPSRRVIYVSNHPLGGLDGLVLACAVDEAYKSIPSLKGKVKFVVNNLLTYIAPMKGMFLGVNKHGSQNRSAAKALDDAFSSDIPMVMFPAGLVSRRHSDGSISDLEWNKMVVTKAIEYRRDIIPLHFSGRNSNFFYNFALLRKLMHIKFNFEMILLPREVFGNRGEHFTITVGDPVPHGTLRGGKEAIDEAQRLREIVYSIS